MLCMLIAIPLAPLISATCLIVRLYHCFDSLSLLSLLFDHQMACFMSIDILVGFMTFPRNQYYIAGACHFNRFFNCHPPIWL